MPAAVVVESTIVERRDARAAGGEQAADVVRERDVAHEQHDRPGRGRGDAERGRRRAVDPVRAAVGQHARRRGARREERLDVADGIEEATTSVASAGSRTPSSAAIRGSLSPAGAEHRRRSRRAAARSARVHASSQPLARGSRGSRACSAASSARGSAGSERRRGAGRVLPGVLGVERRSAASPRRARPATGAAAWRSAGRRRAARAPARARAPQAGSRSSAS